MASHARSRGRAGVAARESQQSGSRLDAVRDSRFAHALSAHQHLTAAALFALFVLAYLWPVLVGGGVLAPLGNLYVTEPWSNVQPADASGLVNLALSDVTLSYYPWDVLARELLREGTFPAWNPYAFAGTPFFANPEVGWLSPFNVPLWTLPLNWALGFSAALKLWTAAFGTYLLVRELRLGFWPGVLAGVSFALCAFHVVWLGNSAFTSVSVLLPWVLWAIERIVRRGRGADGLLLAGLTALVLAGGHPGTQIHLLGGAVVYAVMRVLLVPGERGDRLRRLGLVGGAFVVGTLLMAVVLLPAQQAAIDTAGSAAREGGGTEPFHGANMPFDVLRTMLFPDWWGRPTELIAGPSQYNERTFYAGALALVLAVVALATRGGWRRKAPFAVLGALGALIAVEAPGLHDLVVAIPLFERVQNQRSALWLQFAIAMLAAFGLDRVLREPGRSRRVWGVVGASLLAGLVAALAAGLDGETIDSAVHYVLHRSGDVTEESVALASVLWWLIPVGLLAAILLAVRRRPAWAWLVGGLVVLVAALDMLHFSSGYQPMAPTSRAIPPETPGIDFLQARADEGRIGALGVALPNDWTTVYGLRDVRGYDAPQPSLRFHRLWSTANAEQMLHTTYTFANLEPAALKLTGILGGRFIAGPPGIEEGAAEAPIVYRGDDLTIFENELAMPRAIVASRIHVAADEDEELAAIVDEGFDPRTDVVVRHDELGDTTVPADGADAGSVRVVDEENARVTLRADLTRPAVVVLDDAWERGWRVEVDGEPAQPLQADMVLRGVVVPAGAHEIVWSYRVPGLRPGLVLSGLALLVAGAWGVWLLARRRPA
jgi:hypothetical protein